METNKMRGYCQLELGGKTRTLHFSMNFWVIMEEITGLNIQELSALMTSGLSITNVRNMVYSAIKCNDLEQGNEIDYTIYSVGMWMEEMVPEDFSKVTETLIESRILGQDLNGGLRRNVKKSTTNPKQKSL